MVTINKGMTFAFIYSLYLVWIDFSIGVLVKLYEMMMCNFGV